MMSKYTSHIQINTKSTFTVQKQHVITKHFFLIHGLLYAIIQWTTAYLYHRVFFFHVDGVIMVLKLVVKHLCWCFHSLLTSKLTNSMACSPQANYTDQVATPNFYKWKMLKDSL
jgi:hypothetical protein